MAEQELKLSACGRLIEMVMDLDPNDSQDDWLLQHFQQGRCYEPELAWVMFRALKPGDVAIDVGANVGLFTLLMSKLVGPAGKVIACEPGSNNLPRLRKNIEINGLTNVEIVDKPLWSHREMMPFYLNADSSGGNALFDPGNWPDNVKSRANPNPVLMGTLPLDDAYSLREWVKLIKIDTEGAEQRILEGAKGLLTQHHVPYILAENNPHGLEQADCDETTLRRFMKNLGYDLFMPRPDGTLPSLVPPDTRINPPDDLVISNILFSTLKNISLAWPEVNHG